MVVDRKTKDMDASIELLEDRKKTTNYINYGIMGLFITLSLAYIWLFFLSLDIFEKNINNSIIITKMSFAMPPVFIWV